MLAQHAKLPSSSNGALGVKNYSHEATTSYVFRLPVKRVTPFVSAGAGALVFDPKNFQGSDSQARAAFVYGAGADLTISRHVFMRAEYRGLVYNSPTFNLTSLDGTDRLTHRAEPSIGFGYRFEIAYASAGENACSTTTGLVEQAFGLRC